MSAHIGVHGHRRNGWKPWNCCGKSYMATIRPPADFKEFLRLLTSTGVEYLVVGGYAVDYYGYSRATADIDIWIAIGDMDTEKVAGTLREFGFAKAESGIFREPGKVIRMGVPPVRL
jgi:hypothetical protein